MPRPLLTLVLVAAIAAGATAFASSPDADVHAAIEQAVRERIGRQATVSVEEALVRRAPSSDESSSIALRATPDAGSRIGGPIRFLLSQASDKTNRRIGSVDATVRVSAAHVRVVRPVARGAVIGAGDVVEAVDDLGRVALERLPALADVVGAVARRDLAAGALVQRHTIAAAPLVRSGDEVTTIVRVGSLEARGRAVSAETATRGEIVRVVMPNRRNLRGRVVGAGEVEIER